MYNGDVLLARHPVDLKLLIASPRLLCRLLSETPVFLFWEIENWSN